MTIERILIPIDFSSHSERALEVALELARPLGARLQVLHCFEEVPGGRAPLSSTGIDPALRADALERLKGLLADRDTGGVDVEIDVEPGMDPSAAILKAARQSSPDLIVLGTHGRRGLKRAVLGSVAEEIVREARCPVVTVKAD